MALLFPAAPVLAQGGWRAHRGRQLPVLQGMTRRCTRAVAEPTAAEANFAADVVGTVAEEVGIAVEVAVGRRAAQGHFVAAATVVEPDRAEGVAAQRREEEQ